MKKYILLPVLLSLCCISNLYAGAQADGIAYRNMFAVEEENFAWWCNTSTNLKNALTEDFAGLTRDKINKSLKNNWLDYAGFFYVAREMKEGGMKFCKTIVAADRSNCTGDPYTTYYDYSDNGSYCFWLCKEGYSGPECTKTNQADKCLSTDWIDKNKFEEKTPKLYKATTGTDIDKEIPMLYQGIYKYCGDISKEALDSVKHQEHDMIVIIRSIVEGTDGYTFTVQPAVVRAGGIRVCGYKAEHYAWPMITFVEDLDDKKRAIKNMCPEGWKYENNVCKQDTTQPACQLNNLCDGFPRDKFDPDIYTPKSVDKGCNEYRCNVGAFASKTDRTCVPCPATGADIPSLYYVDEDGLCQKCEVGQWPVDGKCKTATSLSHNKLQYGQEDVPATVSDDECWTMTAPDAYKACVVGGGNTNSNQALIDFLRNKTFFNMHSNASVTAVPSQASGMKAFLPSPETK